MNLHIASHEGCLNECQAHGISGGVTLLYNVKYEGPLIINIIWGYNCGMAKSRYKKNRIPSIGSKVKYINAKNFTQVILSLTYLYTYT
jgi:hypothetical protein